MGLAAWLQRRQAGLGPGLGSLPRFYDQYTRGARGPAPNGPTALASERPSVSHARGTPRESEGDGLTDRGAVGSRGLRAVLFRRGPRLVLASAAAASAAEQRAR